MNVLITSAGRRVKLLKAFEKGLGLINANASVYCADVNPAQSAACNLAMKYFKLPKCTSPDFGAALEELCLSQEISLVIPTIDTELIVLARLKGKFEALGVQLAVSDAGLISLCRDKRLTNRLFVERGVEVPREVDRHNPTFPLFIKPCDGSCSQDLHVIEKQEQLAADLVSNDRLMFMEYLSRDEYQEYTVDLYYDRSSSLKCVVPRLRVEVRGGEVSKGVTRRNSIVDLIYKNFGVVSGAFGCLTMQLFVGKANSKVYGIEINPRFGGGYPLSYAAGADYPLWMMKEVYLNEAILRFDDWEDKLMMLRYDDEVLVRDA